MPNQRKRPTRRAPAGYHDMAYAIEYTGRSRVTLMNALREGRIPEAIQSKPNSPWYFTEAGLRHYLGIREPAEATA